MQFLLALPRLKKQAIAALADAICLPLTFMMAIWLRYDGLTIDVLSHYAILITAVPLISIPIFIRIGLYRAVIRYLDQKIIYIVVLGVTMSVLVLAFISVMTHIMALSRAVFGIYWAGAILYVGASRLLARSYLLGFNRNENAINVAIYGAGKAGVQLATALRSGDEYICVAFIDDNPSKKASLIAGIKVSSSSELHKLIPQHQIKEILLAMPSIPKTRQKQILDELEQYKLKIKVTPSIKSLVNGELRVQDVREVGIEDLLGRDTVEPNPSLLATCITNKNVLVSGAGGSIGSELCRQILRQKPAQLLMLEMSEYALYAIEQELSNLQVNEHIPCVILPFLGSINDSAKLDKIFQTYTIDTVYHAAAYKHVPLVEHNPIEGIRNNVFGSLTLASAAIKAKVSNFVLISTDKAVRPTNVMGASKRLAELILQAFAREQNQTRFCMVRFGNVLGSSGSVVPLFRRQIMQGGPITLTHPEITRYFMTIPEAAQLVLQAGAMTADGGGDVFVLDMGEPVRIIDLARRMVHLSGLEIKSDATPDGTIEIHHVGLRPGEKLFEELLIGDNVEGTSHPLIMRAQEKEIPWPELQVLLQQLDVACNAFDYQKVRTILLKTVAEYEPQCGIEDFLWQAEQASESANPVATVATITNMNNVTNITH
ncbi:nucleoside-diphosphate sugar epimerase/dehydratase [Undibacterium sp. RTI2.1]|uniref:polysaccharide biosynthesis protein n=1 Tax=unclassified Undibacterium TaxID=2630295 RepID=UPI002AB4172A|nr:MULTISPECIES: nucleoside-diphosphate sugar epimerase/dehydratase [unclassified Undibacterium]MDY7540421.1 nucleoside-diphosphate sugar epimerase/dehydratase [Undibacterium sp. 5I1]MEB0032620.1 nucleoside-diphosphate sugar epimerase/dehydratase [Undibacterium sp. RTI2.1]MEB0118489.1 nucleoside-diphosphate sugar epimerase/dehydratase [Undibacterium sp. RTI2.2]MEB0230119.1 nucleoside-diphosphate sugar epimerase/dehydratase [Undibacterium sp. 10I3]MEB0257679.1 nucleoside-diphosphate sugar epime